MTSVKVQFLSFCPFDRCDQSSGTRLFGKFPDFLCVSGIHCAAHTFRESRHSRQYCCLTWILSVLFSFSQFLRGARCAISFLLCVLLGKRCHPMRDRGSRSTGQQLFCLSFDLLRDVHPCKSYLLCVSPFFAFPCQKYIIFFGVYAMLSSHLFFLLLFSKCFAPALWVQTPLTCDRSVRLL